MVCDMIIQVTGEGANRGRLHMYHKLHDGVTHFQYLCALLPPLSSFGSLKSAPSSLAWMCARASDSEVGTQVLIRSGPQMRWHVNQPV